MGADKAKTVSAILNHAICVFAQEGFVGASLRDIATSAGVPHSTINYYYGSKQKLFLEAIARVFDDISKERAALLDAAINLNPNGNVQLKEVLRSLAYPVVRRALAGDKLEAAGIVLLAHNLREAHQARKMLEKADRTIERWISALAEACPSLSRDDVVWVYSYCVGVCYSWQVTLHNYDAMLTSPNVRTVDQVSADIISFTTAGVQSIIEARSCEGRSQA